MSQAGLWALEITELPSAQPGLRLCSPSSGPACCRWDSLPSLAVGGRLPGDPCAPSAGPGTLSLVAFWAQIEPTRSSCCDIYATGCLVLQLPCLALSSHENCGNVQERQARNTTAPSWHVLYPEAQSLAGLLLSETLPKINCEPLGSFKTQHVHELHPEGPAASFSLVRRTLWGRPSTFFPSQGLKAVIVPWTRSVLDSLPF